MIPKSEDVTVVWTKEMALACSVVHDMIASGDEIAARMAFKEVYQHGCQRARDRGEPVEWAITLGYDKNGREGVIKEAVACGRIEATHAKQFLPHLADDEILLLPGVKNLSNKLLSGPLGPQQL